MLKIHTLVLFELKQLMFYLKLNTEILILKLFKTTIYSNKNLLAAYEKCISQ